ncbi:MAG TPA: hypothetical protein VIF14_03870 [Alphaproteobacteria bacterium]|jgi:hypothetical protein
MPGLWDTAEMLIALTGDAEAAIAAAHGMAEDCRKNRRAREARFWRDVALAAVWVGNPQPLIAPLPPPSVAAAGGRGARVLRPRFAARLPRRRQRMLRLKQELRDIFERHAPQRPAKPDEPERED